LVKNFHFLVRQKTKFWYKKYQLLCWKRI